MSEHWQTIEEALIDKRAMAWANNDKEREKDADAALAFVRQMREQQPQPDWSTAPEWAGWWAVNADLEAFWYAFKPYPLTNLTDACWQWSDDDEFKRIGFAGEAVLPLGVDWRTTLQRRPDDAQPQPD